MSPSERVRRHLQSHIVAYIALFVALSGSALALPGRNSVKSNDIKRAAVKGRAIAEGAVKKAKLRDAAVTAPKLDAAAVTGAALADGAVTAPKLAQDSVTRQKVVQGAINGGKLANGSVNSAKVTDGTLLGEDFAPGQLSDGFARTSPGAFTIPAAGPRVRDRQLRLGLLRAAAMHRRIRRAGRRGDRQRGDPHPPAWQRLAPVHAHRPHRSAGGRIPRDRPRRRRRYGDRNAVQVRRRPAPVAAALLP
ncbi:MAG: hypothetical protein ACRDLO_04525 [Solirubrobacterales bacterium]